MINPFVRIQRTGTERGYNTDGRPVEFDTKDQNQWTHSLPLSSLSAETINGTAYYKFLLDINETATDKGKLLSMDDFRLYLGDRPDLLGWNDGFGADSKKIYDIDAGPDGNTRVDLNYKLNHGSGSGDMFVYVPVADFQGFGSQFQYVYLYSAFGNPHSSDAGFEEWWAQTGPSVTPPSPPPNGVPAPPSVVLAGLALGGLGLRRLVRRRPPAVA